MNYDDELQKEIDEMFENCRPVDEVLPELEKSAKELETDPEYYAEYLKAEFADEVEKAMNKLGLKKNNLADKLGLSRQYITRVLNENANFTIKKMAAFAVALGMELEIKMIEKGTRPAIFPVAPDLLYYTYSSHITPIYTFPDLSTDTPLEDNTCRIFHGREASQTNKLQIPINQMI